MVVRDEGKFFYTCDGKTLKSLQEMLNWVNNSDDNSFLHHVNSERNDFSGWTKEVLKDNPLSKRLRPNQSREQMTETIEKRLSEKNKKKNKKKEVISKLKGAILNG